MKIQVLSDPHLEHGGDFPDHHPEADVIVLAGDRVHYTEGLVELLAEFRSTAPYILCVLGNHDFYRTEIDDARAKLAEECAKARIHLLDPGTIRIEDVRFIGATLRTDFELDGPTRTAASHLRSHQGVSDFIGATRSSYAPCDAVPINRGTLVFHWCCPDGYNGTGENLDRKSYGYKTISSINNGLKRMPIGIFFRF